MKRRISVFIAAALAALLAAMSAVQTAHAAVWYWYKPSHPMRHISANPLCTGAWAVRGTDGMFFLTAGHCFQHFDPVRGTDLEFGVVARDEFPGVWTSGNMDALLVRPHAGVDALQEVPGFGRATGRYPNSFLIQAGHPIGMYGGTTGWTTGWTVEGWQARPGRVGERLLCGTYRRAGGDSGGPVFTHDGRGHVTVAGMHVGWVSNPNGGTEFGCYVPIDNLLARFGAWLPVFTSVAAEPTLIGPSADLADDKPVRTAKEGGDDVGADVPAWRATNCL